MVSSLTSTYGAVFLPTADVVSGAKRLLIDMGFAVIPEFSLNNGRRLDLAGLNRRGAFVGVEVKVSVADFRGDRKWPYYLDHCDLFYFAVPLGFPVSLLEAKGARPERTGVIIADRFGGDVLREAKSIRVNAVRRRAETLRFARTAAMRLQRASAID